MIKTLNNTIKQDRTAYKIPRSVQDIIPIQRIFADGIFQFGTKYSRTLRFSDINYAIASKEDKTAMFLGYSELLNALDSGSTTKLTICNKQVNRQAFEDTVLLPQRGDSLDGFVNEFNGMLESKISGSSASVEQERFITVSVHKKNVDEARTFFSRVTGEVSSKLSRLNSSSNELDAAERLDVLRGFFRPDEAALPFDLQSAMKRGHNLKDTICPDSLEFHRDYFKMGNQYGRVLFLKDYASYIKDSMILELTDLNRRMMLSIDMIPVPTDEAVREVENKLLGVETNVTNWQRRQNSNQNFSAVVPYDLEQQRKETREMLDDLTTRDQRMLFAVVTLVHLADSKEELDSDTETLQSIARKHLCQLAKLSFQQQDGLITALPLGLRRIDALRTLTTEALAVLMPFKAQEIRHRHGIYYGQNAISKNLILADRKELLNGNGFILGVSGSGKSFAAKREITEIALSTNDDIIIIDPEAEYRPLVEGLGGEVIEISATSPNHINALDMESGYNDGDNPVVLKSEFLLSLCEQLLVQASCLPRRNPSLTGVLPRPTASSSGTAISALRRHYKTSMPRSWSSRNPKRGTLRWLWNCSQRAASTPLPSTQTWTPIPESFAMTSATSASSFCRSACSLCWTAYSTASSETASSAKIHGYIDEIYLLFQHEYSANFLFTLWKRMRKYGACGTGLTQNVDDLLQSHTARTMLANSEFLLMLNQASTDRIELARLLNISDNQLSYISGVDFGHGLLKCGSTIVPFVDHFPKNGKLYQLMTTKTI